MISLHKKRCACPEHAAISVLEEGGLPMALRDIRSKTVPKYVLVSLNVKAGRSGNYVCDACIAYAKSKHQVRLYGSFKEKTHLSHLVQSCIIAEFAWISRNLKRNVAIFFSLPL